MKDPNLTVRPIAEYLVACALLTGLSGCSNAPIGPTESATVPTGAALFRSITEVDPYTNWAQFPEAEGVVPSLPPHGEMSETRINNVVVSGMENFSGTLGDGAIIVKRSVGGDTDEAEALTIMWKVSGFDPANNDWFWANITESGVVNAQGTIETCVRCHNAARGNDFVFLHQFSSTDQGS